MNNRFFTIIALIGAMTMTGCMKEGPASVEEQATVEPVWTVSIQAEKEIPGQAGNEATKGLGIEGEEATTTALKSFWKTGEEVKVYLGTTLIGTLTATPDGTDAHKATLSGTVTTSSLVAGTSTLTLLTPRESWDYTGQTGVLLETAESIEKKYHYTLASSVLVEAVEGSAITTESATFANQQSIYRLSFGYKLGSDKTPIMAKSVTISAANGHLVQSQAVDGGSLVEGPISVTLGTATADPFFVALRNGDETNAEALTFTVVDAAGVTYRGSKTIPAGYKPNGTFVSVKNATLTERLQLPLSSTEVTTVL